MNKINNFKFKEVRDAECNGDYEWKYWPMEEIITQTINRIENSNSDFFDRICSLFNKSKSFLEFKKSISKFDDTPVNKIFLKEINNSVSDNYQYNKELYEHINADNLKNRNISKKEKERVLKSFSHVYEYNINLHNDLQYAFNKNKSWKTFLKYLSENKPHCFDILAENYVNYIIEDTLECDIEEIHRDMFYFSKHTSKHIEIALCNKEHSWYLDLNKCLNRFFKCNNGSVKDIFDIDERFFNENELKIIYKSIEKEILKDKNVIYDNLLQIKYQDSEIESIYNMFFYMSLNEVNFGGLPENISYSHLYSYKQSLCETVVDFINNKENIEENIQYLLYLISELFNHSVNYLLEIKDVKNILKDLDVEFDCQKYYNDYLKSKYHEASQSIKYLNNKDLELDFKASLPSLIECFSAVKHISDETDKEKEVNLFFKQFLKIMKKSKVAEEEVLNIVRNKNPEIIELFNNKFEEERIKSNIKNF